MSKAGQTTSTGLLPSLPEIDPIEPLVQCGVLYLGTAPPSPGLRGLNSIQEPLSHRYPVDGNNTVRGIDAILSLYDNGLQLTFARQLHSVVFFPIASLIYCASVRFSTIENDQTSLVDWRFLPLDPSAGSHDTKHPPLFCAVIKRTQVISGEECHCFITKSIDTAMALVQAITDIYAQLPSAIPCFKSPVFYQLDRFGRKISETTGIIYLSPADDYDESRSHRRKDRRRADQFIQKCLVDPSMRGYFYRSDAALVEQWQLWDDEDCFGSRPRPPASPFGLHAGLYHDDTTQEIQHYLRHMNDEDQPRSSQSSSGSSKISRTSSSSTGSSRRRTSDDDHDRAKPSVDTDQFNESLSLLRASSFEPQSARHHRSTTAAPIIIEKVQRPTLPPIPILHPTLPDAPQHSYNTFDYVPAANLPSLSYKINERGEKITSEGNRIVFMDVVRPTMANENPNDMPIAAPSTVRRARPNSYRRRSTHVPVLNIESIERLFQNTHSQRERRTSYNAQEAKQFDTSDMIEMVSDYVGDHYGYRKRSDVPNLSPPLLPFERRRRKPSNASSNVSSTAGTHRQREPSTITGVSSLKYGERPFIPILSHNVRSQAVPPLQQQQQQHRGHPPASILTEQQVNEYVSNIYGTARSRTVSTNHSEPQPTPVNTPLPMPTRTVMNPIYQSAFRYMPSSVNSNLLREYRGAYS